MWRWIDGNNNEETYRDGDKDGMYNGKKDWHTEK